MKNNFTEEEIKAAKAMRETILSQGSTIDKARYMSGEIVMWDEQKESCDKMLEALKGARAFFNDSLDIHSFSQEQLELRKKITEAIESAE